LSGGDSKGVGWQRIEMCQGSEWKPCCTEMHRVNRPCAFVIHHRRLQRTGLLSTGFDPVHDRSAWKWRWHKFSVADRGEATDWILKVWGTKGMGLIIGGTTPCPEKNGPIILQALILQMQTYICNFLQGVSRR